MNDTNTTAALFAPQDNRADADEADDLAGPRRPPLPEPQLARWQPLRLGLVELYRYDSEEFWFHHGHLLLRGNNGTGKSKVLSLTLPLLLDASLRPARVEPDTDPGKKMAWNLLLGGAYERRTGMSWIEFGRIGDDGKAQFLTLGVGMHASAAKTQVDAWYFLIEGGARLGRDLWLVTPERHVPGRERLRELLAGQGMVFEQAQSYRRAVDERLFQLGERRYGALMDTLVQLRQPQLSRRPDERALSAALTEALPPLPQDLLADVAEAMTQLEQDRQQLEDTRALADAVQRFEQRYRVYAGIASRRQARALRQAQTEFDRASREHNEAAASLLLTKAAEDASSQRHQNAGQMLAGARERLDTLLADPLNQEANRLDQAAGDARAADSAAQDGERELLEATAQARREAALLQERAARAEAAADALAQARRAATQAAERCGLAADMSALRHAADSIEALLANPPSERDRAALHALPQQRREHVALLRRRLQAVGHALREEQALQQALLDRQAEAEDAAAASAQADDEAEAQAQAHQQAWSQHLLALQELAVDADAVLAALAGWLPLREGAHPARQALLSAQSAAALRLAARRQRLASDAKAIGDEETALREEQARLAAGVDATPLPPPLRGEGTRSGRPGAALWQLVDFDDGLNAVQRAGLEAALQAAGLLDAWVTPDGALLRNDDSGGPWLDTQWLPRPQAVGQRLSRWLRADAPAASAVSAPAVTALLDAIACADDDVPAAEAWVALDGRFRLAALAGAGHKPQAQFVGHAARAAARALRLAEIGLRLQALALEMQRVEAEQRSAQAAEQRMADEWQRAPSEQALLQAHERAAARAREEAAARRRVAEAEARHRAASAAARAAQQDLERDAADLRLPTAAAALDSVEAGVQQLADALHQVAGAVREVLVVWPETERQRERDAEARSRLATRVQRLAALRLRQEEARSRLAALEAALGGSVQELKARIAAAKRLVGRVEAAQTRHGDAWRLAAAAHAKAEQRADTAGSAFAQRSEDRSAAVEQLRRFSATGLLASGLAGTPAAAEVPDPQDPWTIDPALTLARRVEQSLSALDDGDARWKQAQEQVTHDLQELQRSLSALAQGHQAPASTTDFGFVVHIHWNNREERPERLAALLEAELNERRALLSAREREVLENHLQAEIAAEIQRLMRAAAAQVADINRELHRRPTSTGVRFRLLWQPLADGDGAPVGLAAARERLINSSAELWSAEDRQLLGALLKQRIEDERRRGETGVSRTQSATSAASNEGGSLLEQLARALDYRHWHQFRVERLQDGQWRKLSGPASSGERALGLTVPLFAAVASFYRNSPLAPRLVLLDEAFAGIDDAARAHCMALVREFDLDFVITSEREWGCYAELPGVAISQLQRREGIDAVFVSRWLWDGQARRPQADPDRRLPAA